MRTEAAMTADRPSLLILGTRGIPASHGGFETFAEHLALYLAERGWNVGVYCQEDVAKVDRRIRSEHWRGIELIKIQVSSKGPRATLEFDAISVHHAASRQAVSLVLGYNSGLYLPYLRLRGRKIVTNMDGIEWRRPKWSKPVRAWFWVNEWIAAWSSHLLIADHPAIADHLATRRSRRAIAMIPYGGVPVAAAPEAPVRALGLEPGGYLVSIARIEPDNSILPLVQAFSQRPRGAKLVVLGNFDPDNAYHDAVRAAASAEVMFPGAIYDGATVQALRYHARAYVHGHTVGGTNPSLVEALWAGNAVIAHDNVYNRWTAGAAGLFFRDAASCADLMQQLLQDDALVARLSAAARLRAVEEFSWGPILAQYESAARRFLAGGSQAAIAAEQRV